MTAPSLEQVLRYRQARSGDGRLQSPTESTMGNCNHTPSRRCTRRTPAYRGMRPTSCTLRRCRYPAGRRYASAGQLRRQVSQQSLNPPPRGIEVGPQGAAAAADGSRRTPHRPEPHLTTSVLVRRARMVTSQPPDAPPSQAYPLNTSSMQTSTPATALGNSDVRGTSRKPARR